MAPRPPDARNHLAPRVRADRVYQPGDPIPVPDVIEQDSDEAWKLWCETSEGGSGNGYADTQPMGLS